MDFTVVLFRALASAARLRLLFLVHSKPSTTVRELAEACGASEQVTSRHLRMLADLGLLDARPSGRAVHLHPPRPEQSRTALSREVVRLVTQVWQRAEGNSTLLRVWNSVAGSEGGAPGEVEALFQRLVFAFTAYTHLRRLLILRYLADRGATSQERLADEIGMSAPATTRQLAKLHRRGLVTRSGPGAHGPWELAPSPAPPFQRALHAAVMASLTAKR